MPRSTSRSTPSDHAHEHGRLFRRRKPPAGAPPGATVPPADMPVPRLSVIAFNRDQVMEKHGRRLADVSEALAGDRLAWLDVQGLGDETVIREIAGHFKLHQLVLADILNLGQRPKIDLYDDALFAVLRMVLLTPQH